MKSLFSKYNLNGFFDEMFLENREIRPIYKEIYEVFNKFSIDDLKQIQSEIEKYLIEKGITFNDYSQIDSNERIMPLDIIPRIIEKHEWQKLEIGLKQRVTALNLFLEDIYGSQHILNDGTISRKLIETSKHFLKECIGIKPHKNIWIHVSGIDLIRGNDGIYRVLEDNLRCPSGVSYFLENRKISEKYFSNCTIFSDIENINDYPKKLSEMLHYISLKKNHTVGVLSPGVYNSAYYEHSYLAEKMGIDLIEPQDLVVLNGRLKKRTIKGFETLDVIYRRIDDIFLDTNVFKKDSLLSIKGLFEVYKKGNIAIANAFGTGVADDKVIYAYTPKIIKYYLNQEPIIPIVETYLFDNKASVRYVIDNLEKLVVKEANEAGGKGMLIGSEATKEEMEIFRKKIKANPRDFIAQPIVQLSRLPSFIENKLIGTHIDLRPYIIYGKDISITKGGLTRVALKENSLVVNSSKGGGSKDTWVL